MKHARTLLSVWRLLRHALEGHSSCPGWNMQGVLNMCTLEQRE